MNLKAKSLVSILSIFSVALTVSCNKKPAENTAPSVTTIANTGINSKSKEYLYDFKKTSKGAQYKVGPEDKISKYTLSVYENGKLVSSKTVADPTYIKNIQERTTTIQLIKNNLQFDDKNYIQLTLLNNMDAVAMTFRFDKNDVVRLNGDGENYSYGTLKNNYSYYKKIFDNTK